ncbi:hypothetical protein GCM10010345_85550 [Streptomyces canarius]|uniref:RHS repeat-associated core domain-containing protein n=1 Tax=Streptomyces canarius TaxID=285453 RepID=A0ABQ3DA33_9ACTN|nr:hypothetical protein GCM10010345_85550 [Streptomyces canarius]
MKPRSSGLCPIFPAFGRGRRCSADTSGNWTQTASKLNHYDSDNPRWTVEDTATGTLTRNVDGLDGNLAATTNKSGGTVLTLSDLHGDTALQLPADSSVAPTVLDYDEYGNPRAGQDTVRYGWLGGKQRSSETLTGLTLMGVRLYDPATGRFLSTDPVPGGSANAYKYCNGDPVNQFDLDGQWSWRKLAPDRSLCWQTAPTRAPAPPSAPRTTTTANSPSTTSTSTATTLDSEPPVNAPSPDSSPGASCAGHAPPPAASAAPSKPSTCY